MPLKTTKFDAAEYLKTPEDVASFLNDAFETGAPEEIVHALGIAARARGMTEVAKLAGVGRESLYKALGEGGNPEFSTVMKVAQALGVVLTVQWRAPDPLSKLLPETDGKVLVQTSKPRTSKVRAAA
ncbi:putative addiction module antidote protein [Panacagrimonas perspica]|uniref:Putative addiction module antidote protein n=1 Tax=Panacagrimonas perspica TaxID=381431 RepID=A0A4R7P441_9GAMM|nr:addiction module antidote protein [Panacagrimonas perspica]TDU28447.1 putative addiction module antidote protein [Panacagrimonas perspica]THD00601.1 putative addiction module antidote protein [Panacagrimonas perspica]